MNRSFAGSMPEFYDRILVPVMFEPFAQDLAGQLRGMTSGHILEIAAGTGIVTRALARVLPPEVAITATDLNPAMSHEKGPFIRSCSVIGSRPTDPGPTSRRSVTSIHFLGAATIVGAG
jgi:hypothetical protein